MTPIYRLMFDVSVYYTVSGIYLQAFFGKLLSLIKDLYYLSKVVNCKLSCYL